MSAGGDPGSEFGGEERGSKFSGEGVLLHGDMGIVLKQAPVWNRLYELICYTCAHIFKT